MRYKLPSLVFDATLVLPPDPVKVDIPASGFAQPGQYVICDVLSDGTLGPTSARSELVFHVTAIPVDPAPADPVAPPPTMPPATTPDPAPAPVPPGDGTPAAPPALPRMKLTYVDGTGALVSIVVWIEPLDPLPMPIPATPA